MAMQIGTYVPTVPVNPYAEDIAALIKATEAVKDGDPIPTGIWSVPVDDEGKTKFKIGKAANEAGRTAALVSDEISKDGKTVTLVFRIKDRHKSGPRNRRSRQTVETTAE